MKPIISVKEARKLLGNDYEKPTDEKMIWKSQGVGQMERWGLSQKQVGMLYGSILMA